MDKCRALSVFMTYGVQLLKPNNLLSLILRHAQPKEII